MIVVVARFCASSCFALEISLVVLMLVSTFGVHQGDRIYGSIVSILSVGHENSCNAFSKFDRYVETARTISSIKLHDKIR